MANWLDKYEQGGLVLKKKTKDNYGKKANPNDVKASVGPDFVGLGYNTKGRDYSPAWGGQFQMGGVLGKRFLQPNDSKLPKGWNSKEKGYSTEYSTTIGKDGEYYLVPGFKQGKLVSDPEREFNKTGELLGGPFKTIQSAQDFADRRHKYVEQGKPVPSPLKTYDEFAMGGSMPGAVGFMYARTQNPAPSNGKYAKKTKASAQNGQEMKFYQEGLDFKPKTISKNGSVIKDDRGQLAYPGEITQIGSNEITMKGVDYPVLGISDTGDTKMMKPGKDYKFDGNMVTEYPLAQDGENINKKLKKEAEEKLERLKKPKATISQYTPKKGEQAKFDKQKLERIAEESKPLNRFARSKAAGNLEDAAMFAAEIMTLGEAAALTKPALKAAAKYATEKTALKNAHNLNPYRFKPNPTKYYRQAGKAAYDDAVKESKMYAKGQKELLERNSNINYTNEYNASIAADEAGKFHLTKPASAPFVQKGKLFYPINRKPTGTGYKGTRFADAEYLFEGSLPDEAVLPRYQEKYLSSLEQSGGVGVVRPEFNDLDNFKIYKRHWLKGYKEVPKKEEGGWLNKYK